MVYSIIMIGLLVLAGLAFGISMNWLDEWNNKE